MVDYLQLLGLGAIAGFTIFLGLPLAVLRSVSPKKKGFLNAFAMGILIFLIIDVFGHSWQSASNAAAAAFAGRLPLGDASFDLVAMFGGVALGLLGLVLYESRYMKKASSLVEQPSVALAHSAAGLPVFLHQKLLLQQQEAFAYRLSTMIAIGIGAHNFSEGLAIGQSYAAGAIGLTLLLIIGFGAHNTTEGFGIAGPLTLTEKRPSISFLTSVGLIGGGPTFLGTLVGSLVGVSTFTYILFLTIAGGSLIYVTMLMYNSGRRQTTNTILMGGIFVGLTAGFVTDLMVTLGGA